MIFFGLLSLIARGMSLQRRFLLAVLIEAGWEVLENSPIIINRYRSATISLGYEGDSILNSLSDVVMMALGFFYACRVRLRYVVVTILIMEIGCAFWIRDNLILNIIMLIHPVEAIKHWQMAGHPVH